MQRLANPHASREIIGGESRPAKMPCLCYGIPATRCKLGSLLRPIEGTTCHNCYALKGQYQFPNVVAAMERRFATLGEALASPVAGAAWIEAWIDIHAYRYDCTARVIERTGKPGADDGRYFRWHDSGDLQSVGHLALIAAIADASPLTRFWLPTREIGMVGAWLDGGGVIAPNLNIRLSTARIGQSATGAIARLAATVPGITVSGVHREKGAPPDGMAECQAYRNEGACGDCRACWTVPAVSYPEH